MCKSKALLANLIKLERWAARRGSSSPRAALAVMSDFQA
jgi:hypothetical protein